MDFPQKVPESVNLVGKPVIFISLRYLNNSTFVEVRAHGGDVSVVHLPQVGLKGNTHFPFLDLGNIELADLMFKWLKEKKLDK